MAVFDAYMLIQYIQTFDGTQMTGNQGIKALVFGILLGTAGYLSGISLGLRVETILN